MRWLRGHERILSEHAHQFVVIAGLDPAIQSEADESRVEGTE